MTERDRWCPCRNRRCCYSHSRADFPLFLKAGRKEGRKEQGQERETEKEDMSGSMIEGDVKQKREGNERETKKENENPRKK